MTPAEIAKLTEPKLKAELKDRGLDDTGLKKVLAERLTRDGRARRYYTRSTRAIYISWL